MTIVSVLKAILVPWATVPLTYYGVDLILHIGGGTSFLATTLLLPTSAVAAFAATLSYFAISHRVVAAIAATIGLMNWSLAYMFVGSRFVWNAIGAGVLSDVDHLLQMMLWSPIVAMSASVYDGSFFAFILTPPALLVTALTMRTRRAAGADGPARVDRRDVKLEERNGVDRGAPPPEPLAVQVASCGLCGLPASAPGTLRVAQRAVCATCLAEIRSAFDAEDAAAPSTMRNDAGRSALAEFLRWGGDAAFVIEPCASVEQPGWLALRCALWPDDAAENHLVEMAALVADRSRYLQLVAYSAEREPLGLVEASLRSDHVNGTESSPVAFLEGVYVAPQARRRGVATALIHAVKQWARAAGCSEIASDASLDNDGSHAMHRALGFAETERVVFYRQRLP